MSFDFNADEVFEIAEQLERNGAKFYRSTAKNIEDKNKKKLLFNLTEMEDEHELTFKSMRERLSEDEKTMTQFNPDDETSGYLRALADTRVFYEKEVDTSSFEEFLKNAIAAEKDSIVFYLWNSTKKYIIWT